MRIAKGIVDDLHSLLMTVKDEEKRISKEMSDIDKLINEIYHELEIVKLGTVQAYKVMVRLQELLRQRRTIKHEWRAIQSLDEHVRSNRLIHRANKAQKQIDKVINKEEKVVKNHGVIKSILEQACDKCN